MALPDYPKVMPSPMAEGGTRTSIPDTSETGFSYADGFPVITQIPPGSGGQAPTRADFNGAFFEVSEHIYFSQAGGWYEWKANIDYNVNAVLLASDGNFYKSLKVSGPGVGGAKNPADGANPEFWEPFAKGAELTDRVDLESSVIGASATAVKIAYDKAAKPATLAEAGIVQLSTSISSDSETLAATPSSVKAALEEAKRLATLATAGIVQLSNAVNSTSQTTAATSYAVKQAYDRAGQGVELTDRVDLVSSVIAASATAVKTAYDKAGTLATVAAPGIVQLSTSVTSNSTTHAATSSAVSTTYALAVNALPKTGKAVDSEAVDGVSSERIPFGESQTATTRTFDWFSIQKSGFYDGDSALNAPYSGWFWGLKSSHRDHGTWGLVLVAGISSNNFYISSVNEVGAGAWNRILTDQNGPFSAGTRMLFQQSAAPPGWVKETNAAYNNVALRIVTGDVSSGGNLDFSSVFTNKAYTVTGTVGATTLSVGQLAAHNHTAALTNSETGTSQLPTCGTVSQGNMTTNSAGSSQSHSHSFYSGAASVNLSVKYRDFIIAAKG